MKMPDLSVKVQIGAAAPVEVGTISFSAKPEPDSTWSPPLELPTEPTWGIAVIPRDHSETSMWFLVGEWQLQSNPKRFFSKGHGAYPADDPLDFIPLTPEQVRRIEANR